MRVALARALYQNNTDVFVFDDILASLDSHVAQVTRRVPLLQLFPQLTNQWVGSMYGLLCKSTGTTWHIHRHVWH